MAERGRGSRRVVGRHLTSDGLRLRSRSRSWGGTPSAASSKVLYREPGWAKVQLSISRQILPSSTASQASQLALRANFFLFFTV